MTVDIKVGDRLTLRRAKGEKLTVIAGATPGGWGGFDKHCELYLDSWERRGWRLVKVNGRRTSSDVRSES